MKVCTYLKFRPVFIFRVDITKQLVKWLVFVFAGIVRGDFNVF